MEERKVKQVIVFRKDLLKGGNSIRKGKFGAQCSHASVGALLSTFTKVNKNTLHLEFEDNSPLDKWINGLFTKICLSVESDDELVALYKAIKERAPHIPCVLITDCGKTEFNGVPTNTCIGIGPWWADEIDEFTNSLKLL